MQGMNIPDSARIPPLPKELSRLGELAFNLWWSWHPDARALFKGLDRSLWKESDHNPIKVLQSVNPERLQAVAKDPSFLVTYRSVVARYDECRGRPASGGLIAYFSPEFAVDSTLPIYSGGLGILAGDILKEASDLALPMVGISFNYPKGYFHQRLLPDGWQLAQDEEMPWLETPLRAVLDRERRQVIVSVPLADRTIRACAWQLAVGRSIIYLLDTNLMENHPEDRDLSAKLYPSHRETQLKQHIVLGIGGVRMLRALGYSPETWHINEAHTGLLVVERILEAIDKGASFEEAVAAIAKDTVFTTHTPLLHGSAQFPRDWVARFMAPYFPLMKVDPERFLDLGKLPNDENLFCLAAMLLRLLNRANAVSARHEEVSREMWKPLWPERPMDQVPINHVTNGVHVPTWIAGEMYGLMSRHLGSDWISTHDDEMLWKLLAQVPDEEFSNARRKLKQKLLAHVLDCCRKRWQEDPRDGTQAIAMGSMLDPRTLTLGFCRRFTGYKRPLLVFRDIERLKKLLNNNWHPVQIIFAGKSHPEDRQGHEMTQRIYQFAKDPALGGRIAFVEDYDMHTAKYLVQGVDVWLNNPVPGLEASGTSGMKAALNGVPQLSVLDGWWVEGYTGKNGWAVEAGALEGDFEWRHAQAIYDLLETQIIPTYYDLDIRGVSVRWVQICKEALGVAAARFSARRMVKDYRRMMYVQPAAAPAEESLQR